MFKYSMVLVALAMVVAVTAKVIPTAVEPRAGFITYEGNNLFIGRRTDDDFRAFRFEVNQAGVLGMATNSSLEILPQGNIRITYMEVLDRAEDTTLGAYPTLISGGPGTNVAKLFWQSKVGEPINSEGFVWLVRLD